MGKSMSQRCYLLPTLIVSLIVVLAAYWLWESGAGNKVSNGHKPHFLRLQGRTMGTSFHIKIRQPGQQTLATQQLQQQITATLDRINVRMSTYRQDSDLSRLARKPPEQPLEVHPETLRVVATGMDISRKSNGAFAMTIGPLVNLWGFGPKLNLQKIPDDKTIASLLPKLQPTAIDVKQNPPRLIRHNSKVSLDLSAIAKGYAVDQVAEVLNATGYNHYLVEVGGELRVKGQRAKDQKWQVALERPQAQTHEINQILPLSNVAMATSGDYRNYFEKDGVRYSHTINPNTGKPIRHRLASVSVLHPQCMYADAWATALMVLGPVKGMRLAKKQQLAAVFLVKTAQGTGFSQLTSDAFEQRYHRVHKE